jgi:hypothetical protein
MGNLSSDLKSDYYSLIFAGAEKWYNDRAGNSFLYSNEENNGHNVHRAILLCVFALRSGSYTADLSARR